MIKLSHAQAIMNGAHEVHIRYRYDKSSKTFQTRKYRVMPGHMLCPVALSLSIILRARVLRVPANEPIGVYRKSPAGDRAFITGPDIRDVLRRWCKIAYPNENHYMRLHIDQIVAHSYRVTACVALNNAGIKEPEIVWGTLRQSVTTSENAANQPRNTRHMLF